MNIHQEDSPVFYTLPIQCAFCCGINFSGGQSDHEGLSCTSKLHNSLWQQLDVLKGSVRRSYPSYFPVDESSPQGVQRKENPAVNEKGGTYPYPHPLYIFITACSL